MFSGKDRCDCHCCVFFPSFVLQLFRLKFWMLGCFILHHSDVHFILDTWQRWAYQIAANSLSHTPCPSTKPCHCQHNRQNKKHVADGRFFSRTILPKVWFFPKLATSQMWDLNIISCCAQGFACRTFKACMGCLQRFPMLTFNIVSIDRQLRRTKSRAFAPLANCSMLSVISMGTSYAAFAFFFGRNPANAFGKKPLAPVGARVFELLDVLLSANPEVASTFVWQWPLAKSDR